MVRRAGVAVVVIATLTVAGISPATATRGHRHRRHHHAHTSGVRGVVTAGPVCPVEFAPPVPPCEDRVVPANLTLQRGDGGPVVARGQAGDDGLFQIDAEPGHYTLSAASPDAMFCTPQPVTVVSSTYTDVHVNCDTGIR